MFTLTQVLGLVAQSLGMSQDALEKSLIDRLAKLDKGVQDIYMLLGRVSNSLADAPGGADLSGNAAGGLISPAVIAALPPLQTLDSTLSDLLLKLEPSIKLLLQFRDAAEKAVNGNEALTASLTAMAVAARGVSNLMSGLRADGSPRREPDHAMRAAVLTGSATQRTVPGTTSAKAPASASIYYATPPGIPGSDKAHSESTSVYSVSLPDEVKYNSPLEELYSRPQGSPLVDATTAQILNYLARFEPILQGIDKKSVDCLQYLRIIQAQNCGYGGSGSLSSQAGDAVLGVAGGLAAGMITGPAVVPVLIILTAAGILLKVMDTQTYKEMDAYRNNLKYEYLNKFYAHPNPNQKENFPPELEFKDSKLEHPAASTISAIESIPPSTISNITNNYYNNTTNKNESYYGSLSRHEFDQINFNKCLDKAMIELVQAVESGMRTC